MSDPLQDGRTPRRQRVGFWLYALHLWTVAGLALSNGFIVLTALLSPWTVAWRRVDWPRLRPVLAPLAAYTGVLLLAIANSVEPGKSVRALGETSGLAALFFALLLVRDETAVRRVVDGMVLVAGLLAVLGLGQFLVGFGDIEHRIRGPFSHYMTLAGVLLMADLVLAAQLVCNRRTRTWWRWLVLVAINLALLGGLTRSAWVAVLAAFTLLLVIRAPRALLAYIPAALLFVTLAPTPIVHRAVSIFDLQDVSNYDRLCMAEAGLHMVAERPLLGLGPGMVKVRYPIYRHPTAPRPWVPHLHNSFLELAAERGLAGLGSYLWLMGASLLCAWRGYRRWRGVPAGPADLFVGALLGLVAFNVAGLFENNWGDTEVQRLALFLAAIPFCLGAAGGARIVPAAPGGGGGSG